jgi:uncharacterized protein (TIGR00661 family)
MNNNFKEMNILYGLPSEGMGHATRSKVIIDYLRSQGHRVIIVTSDRAYHFMKNFYGDDVHQIKGFHFAYENAIVSIKETIKLTLKNAPESLVANMKEYINLFASCKFELVISDFESFTNFYAKLTRTPLVCVDNIQIVDRAKLEIKIPANERSNYLLARKIIQWKVPHAHHYFITTFFNPEILKKNTSYVPPILRKEIEEAKASIRNHIVVYQTSSSQINLIQILNQLEHETFYVYGFNKDETHGNVTLKAFSEQGFIQDFASAKAVIANGGFSFLSEAVYLQKPIFSVPIKNQFEQFLNASYIEQLNYGKHFDDFNVNNINMFLSELPLFYKALSHYHQDGNKELYHLLNEKMQEIAHQHKAKM